MEYMNSMFAGATSFNQPLNNWNVSNVTDMMLMFTRARSFNRPLNNWNVSKVETMFAIGRDPGLHRVRLAAGPALRQ